MAFTPEQKRAYRKRNRERLNAYARAWRAKNPDKAKAYSERGKERDRRKRRRLRALNPLIARPRMPIEERRRRQRMRDQRRRQLEKTIRLWEQALVGLNVWGKSKLTGYQWVEPEGQIREHTIYALRDPRTQEVRYVGKTVNPRGRLKVHLHHARRGTSWHVSRWIRELFAEGLLPQWEVLEIARGNAAACERECYRIE